MEEEIEGRIKVNDVISYKCASVQSDGVPIRPSIYQIRWDISWSDALKTKSKMESKLEANNSKRTRNVSFYLVTNREIEVRRPTGKWRDIRKQRSFFEAYARSHNFNPLNADAWYSVPLRDILKVVCFISIIWFL